MAAATEGLLSLPVELLAHTCSFLLPREVLSFALSSRACAVGGADILRGLQNIFLEYKTLNDNDPFGLPDKLRIILKDDFRAHCVRHLEIGDTKSSWTEWKSSNDDRHQPSESSDDTAISELTLEPQNSPMETLEWQSYYTYDELEQYRRLLRAYIFRNFTANTLSNESVRERSHLVLILCLQLAQPRMPSLTARMYANLF